MIRNPVIVACPVPIKRIVQPTQLGRGRAEAARYGSFGDQLPLIAI
jgi:hypothetical protein